MNTNTLSIQIHRPINHVFDFTIDPKNTPSWIDGIVAEETSEWPINIGTIYRNKNSVGAWSTYTVTALQANALFELAAEDTNYHVRYSYEILSENTTKLTYAEWVDSGDLEHPFTEKTLQKLKEGIEST